MHTPAPWKWEDWTYIGEGEGPNKLTLTADPSCRSTGPSDMFPDLRFPILSCEEPIENEEDGWLIEAAPELLAACKEFVRKVECGEARSKRSYAQMKAAIAKAERR
jgi:hypothetical protein